MKTPERGFLGPTLGDRVSKIDAKTGAQFSRFSSLAYEIIRKRNPSSIQDPKRFITGAVFNTHSEAEMPVPENASSEIPPIIRDLLDHLKCDTNSLRIKIEIDLAGERSVSSSTPWHENEIKGRKISIYITGPNSRNGWLFKIDFRQGAHRSTANFYPHLFDYVHELYRLSPENPRGDDHDGDSTKVIINGPQYAQVRWEIFEELYQWLAKNFAQDIPPQQQSLPHNPLAISQ